MEGLFGHRWDAFALLCLADGLLRYTDLGDAISKRADERIPDAMLTRSLRRLAECELVQPQSDGSGYTLTHDGLAQAAILARFSKVLRAADRSRAQQARRTTGADRRELATSPREGSTRRNTSEAGRSSR